jgi:hypothetical protein
MVPGRRVAEEGGDRDVGAADREGACHADGPSAAFPRQTARCDLEWSYRSVVSAGPGRTARASPSLQGSPTPGATHCRAPAGAPCPGRRWGPLGHLLLHSTSPGPAARGKGPGPALGHRTSTEGAGALSGRRPGALLHAQGGPEGLEWGRPPDSASQKLTSGADLRRLGVSPGVALPQAGSLSGAACTGPQRGSPLHAGPARLQRLPDRGSTARARTASGRLSPECLGDLRRSGATPAVLDL